MSDSKLLGMYVIYKNGFARSKQNICFGMVKPSVYPLHAFLPPSSVVK